MIFGVLILAIMSGVIVLLNPALFIPVLFADLWLLGYHHVISTFTKLAGTAQDREDNKFLIYYLPFIVLGAVFSIQYLVGTWAIVTIYFFWQWYHYTRQSYGISTFYRHKSGVKNSSTPPRLDLAAIWAVPIWGVVHRCAQGWEKFLFQPVWLPQIPLWADTVVGVAASAVLLWWFVTKITDWSQGNLAYGSFFYVVSHHTAFYIGYIFIPDITFGWLVSNIWHNAQYILFVWLFNQNRFQSAETKEQSPVLHWLSQRNPFRTLAYFFVSIVLTTLLYNGLDMGVNWISGADTAKVAAFTIILYQTINFHHYIVDSRIWKARKKSHQKIMKINV
ncbi:MAG: hypothetical protein JKY60_17105 [Kordiimonadaceae bacterium]|nr:hypothetical protein [Kordiimonadaceae bacterium]